MHPKFQNSKYTPSLVDYLYIFAEDSKSLSPPPLPEEPGKQFWLFRGLLGLYHVFRRSRRFTIYGHCQVQQGNYTENCG